MSKNKYLPGSIKRHPDGFGFFIPDDSEHPDVYIPRHNMKGAMTSDRVLVEAFPERGTQRFSGNIIRITEHGIKKVVGVFNNLNAKMGVVRDEGKGWGQDLQVPLEESLGAKPGELVAVEIISYPEEKNGLTGRVTEVLGHSLDPLTDVKRVVHGNNIPVDFSQAALKQAETFSETVSPEDMKGRKNLREKKFITIDGATARDFDDAILVETSHQGFRLWVAIADVSHYVTVGSAIDKDAYVRGTSVYFPNHVIPMLPEVLSNGLCSLNPHVPRLALVAELQFDFTGTVLATDFYEAVIESKARVTYGEAQEVIDGNEVEKLDHVKEQILLASDLAKILMGRRFKEGSLELEIPEVQIVLDGAGVPIDMIKTERLFAHRLIEEMMLAANVAVAKFLTEKNIPAIYRIHEPPNPETMKLLEKYLWNFGSKVDMGAGKLQKRLTRALQEFEGKAEAQILNILALRSMSQAKYSPNNVGHFGLGFDHYTHFTSPIRRYPDLIVHRLLKSQIMRSSRYRTMTEEDLATAGNMLSACEQRSAKSERQFQAIKKARFMEKHIGEEFEGVISSVTKFGAFVLLRNFEVDGLIKLESLSKEKLEFDEENLWLVGRRSGFRFAIGDHVKIKVKDADVEAGQVDFDLIEVLASSDPAENEVHPHLQKEVRDSGFSSKGKGHGRRRSEKKSNANDYEGKKRSHKERDRKESFQGRNQKKEAKSSHRHGGKHEKSGAKFSRGQEPTERHEKPKLPSPVTSEESSLQKELSKIQKEGTGRSRKAEILDRLDQLIAEKNNEGFVERRNSFGRRSTDRAPERPERPADKNKLAFGKHKKTDSHKKSKSAGSQRRRER